MGDAGSGGGVVAVADRLAGSIADARRDGDRDRDMLRLAFCRPWRRTGGLLHSVARLIRLEVGIPDHTTLSRCGAAISLATELAEAKGPGHGIIDSTGLKVYGAVGANGIWRSIPTAAIFWPAS